MPIGTTWSFPVQIRAARPDSRARVSSTLSPLPEGRMKYKRPKYEPRECSKYYQQERRHFSCVHHFRDERAAKLFRRELENEYPGREIRIWRDVTIWHVGTDGPRITKA